MSLLKQTWRFLGACAVFALAPVANAQDSLPLAEPMEFNPDWQWFAPVDADELSESSLRKRGNYGWFASHDRMRIWVSRPDTSGANFAGDFVGGHRTDLGFVRENGSGWLFNYSKLTNLSVYHGTFTERINRVNTADPTGGVSTATTQVFPFVDRNDPWTLSRSYNLADSLNAGGYWNFEINKTWRRSPYRYGGILEPLIGLKYANFTDNTQDQNYFRSNTQITNPAGTTTSTQLETLQSWETTNLNRLIGGQIGARYFNSYRKFRIGAEFRTFLAGNFQTVTHAHNTYITEYGAAPAINAAVAATEYTSVLDYRTRQSLAWGFETRLDTSYQVTKYIGLRAGVQVVDLARGIMRGGERIGPANITPPTSAKLQNVLMAGLTVGIELNR